MTDMKPWLSSLCLCFAVAASSPALAQLGRYPVKTDCDTVRTVNPKAHASWYGSRFHGRQTANGETFNMYALTAAHKTLALGSHILVENVANGARLVLRVNDRGPYVQGRNLDVSRRAADILGFREEGLAKVKISLCAK